MKMDADESWIEGEIERELALLVDDATDDDQPEEDDVSTEIGESDEIDVYLKKYQDRSNNVVDSIHNQLNDIDQLLVEKRVKEIETSFDEEIVNAARLRGVDVQTLNWQILSELDAEDADDAQVSEAELVEVQTETVPTENPVEMTAEEGALVEFFESDELERQFRQQMTEWSRRQKEKENQRTIENEHGYNRIKERLSQLETQRQNLLDTMKREEISLEKTKTLRTAEIDIEAEEAMHELKIEEVHHEKALREIEKERNLQETYMEGLKSLAHSIENNKKHKAATKIQCLWRGFQARQEFGETVQEWIQHGKLKREEKRLREIENERISREAAEKKRVEEEQKESRRLEMERLKQEEKQRQEEKERLRKIEEEKIEAERKRTREEEREKKLEEERKRLLEEEKKAKELVRQEEARKIREEVERQKAEEERIEQERLEAEKKSAEERRLEELKRVEEEKKKQQEMEAEEEKRRIEEERKRKEEDHKAKVELLRKLEEKKKKEQEEKMMREEEEKRRKEEERKKAELKAAEDAKLAEEQELEKSALEEFSAKFGNIISPSKSDSESGIIDPGPSFDELIQKSRLSWMQSCIPLSKLLMEAKSRKVIPSIIPKRRPSSSKKLTVLPDSYVFVDGLTDSYEEVFTLLLKNLPAYNMQALSACVNLTVVEIRHCHIVLLDVFASCPHLQSLVCTNSKVEVVNLKNSTELVYLDLSENQISSIHGLDNCHNLGHLNLGKNRITKIENLSHLRNLHTLRLNRNSIIRTTNISEAPNLQILDLSRNNLRKTGEFEKLALLRELDLSNNSLDYIPVWTNNVLLEKVHLQHNCLTEVDALSVFWLPLLKELNLSNNSLQSVPKLTSTISLTTLDLSENSISDLDDFLPNLIHCERLETLSIGPNPVVQLVPNLRDLVKTALPWLKNIDGFTIENKFASKYDSDFFRLCSSQLRANQRLDTTYRSKLEEVANADVESVPMVHKQYFEKSLKMANDCRYAHEYGDLKMDLGGEEFFQFRLETLRSETPAPKTEAKPDLQSLSKTNVVDAKSKFDMALGPTKPRSDTLTESRDAFERALNKQTEGKTKVPPKQLPPQEKAAIKIQALWRGYIYRKRLAMACDFAGDLDAEFGNFDEVDLGSWDLDEGVLDQDWVPPANPNLVTDTPVLRPIQPGPPREAWLNLASKPPRSPAPTMDLETTRTKASKSEQLTEEWGFKDARTAEMMMRRARKLKYDALKRKRLAQLDPKQRLVLMRKLEESTHLPAVQPPRRGQNPRKDYFRAKEEEAQRERLEKMAESQNKMHRMYEWLHTAADGQDTTRTTTTVSHRPPLALRRADWGGSDGSLPKLDERRTHRSPVADHVSLVSVESDRSGRRFSYDGQLNKKVPFPPIKNNSAPSAQRSEPEMGWGGGKKRNAKRLS